MRKKLAGIGLAFLLSALPQARAQDAQGRWQVYTNVRFQYALCYPKDLFSPQGETVNSAGNTFLGQHGEKLVVYGENSDETPAELRDREVNLTKSRFGPVTYQARLAHGFVISAKSNDTILYSKTLLSNGQYKAFTLTYPVSENTLFDPVAKGLNTCFTDLERGPKIHFPTLY